MQTEKSSAVDLAFYLPGRFDRTQPGDLGTRNQKEVGGAALYLNGDAIPTSRFGRVWYFVDLDRRAKLRETARQGAEGVGDPCSKSH
jgi:hypothetical protein